ncbi:hypothetical protein BDV96DRAFT_145361 [Lophiotrema nucula]|uniref:Uncharacterized protein n=1 Tax=Lophiotrema nucula TaxID=690887 RepID=A0A6A5Z1X3_9PLEO|nr:hypothetical protein BDV96DRAFT_145361 [Lophiotrema nucula]
MHVRSQNSTSPSSQYKRTFDYKLKQKIDQWAQGEDADANVRSPMFKWARDYLETLGALSDIENEVEYNAKFKRLAVLERLLGVAYILNHVKVVFCNMPSMATHPLLVCAHWSTLTILIKSASIRYTAGRGFKMPRIIIDNAEAAKLTDFAEVFNAHRGKFTRVVLAGNLKGETPQFASADCNESFALTSRNFFEECVANPSYETCNLVQVYPKRSDGGSSGN